MWRLCTCFFREAGLVVLVEGVEMLCKGCGLGASTGWRWWWCQSDYCCTYYKEHVWRGSRCIHIVTVKISTREYQLQITSSIQNRPLEITENPARVRILSTTPKLFSSGRWFRCAKCGLADGAESNTSGVLDRWPKAQFIYKERRGTTNMTMMTFALWCGTNYKTPESTYIQQLHMT